MVAPGSALGVEGRNGLVERQLSLIRAAAGRSRRSSSGRVRRGDTGCPAEPPGPLGVLAAQPALPDDVGFADDGGRQPRDSRLLAQGFEVALEPGVQQRIGRRPSGRPAARRLGRRQQGGRARQVELVWSPSSYRNLPALGPAGRQRDGEPDTEDVCQPQVDQPPVNGAGGGGGPAGTRRGAARRHCMTAWTASPKAGPDSRAGRPAR